MKKIKVLGLLMMLATVSMVGCGKEPEYVPGGGFTDAVYDEVVEEIEEIEEADPFAIPEVIEGKVPTKNEVYLTLEEAGCVADDDHRFDLYLNGSDENMKYVEYWSEQQTNDPNAEYLFSRYFKKESAEEAKRVISARYENLVEQTTKEPDISKDTHYCIEEIEHAMKNSCEVITFKKTLHDKHCNVVTEGNVYSYETSWGGTEYEPVYMMVQDICKGDGYLNLEYSSDAEGNPLCESAQKTIQIYKDLEFITFE